MYRYKIHVHEHNRLQGTAIARKGVGWRTYLEQHSCAAANQCARQAAGSSWGVCHGDSTAWGDGCVPAQVNNQGLQVCGIRVHLAELTQRADSGRSQDAAAGGAGCIMRAGQGMGQSHAVLAASAALPIALP